jgi:hypothetical protein
MNFFISCLKSGRTSRVYYFMSGGYALVRCNFVQG